MICDAYFKYLHCESLIVLYHSYWISFYSDLQQQCKIEMISNALLNSASVVDRTNKIKWNKYNWNCLVPKYLLSNAVKNSRVRNIVLFVISFDISNERKSVCHKKCLP